VLGDVRDRGQPQPGLVEILTIAIGVRHRRGRPIEPKPPAVVRAGKARRVAALERTHCVRSVSAAVHEHPHLAVLVADEDDRLAPHSPLTKIARIRNFRGVADEQPSAVEYPINLLLENLGIGLEPGVDPIMADQVV